MRAETVSHSVALEELTRTLPEKTAFVALLVDGGTVAALDVEGKKLKTLFHVPTSEHDPSVTQVRVAKDGRTVWLVWREHWMRDTIIFEHDLETDRTSSQMVPGYPVLSHDGTRYAAVLDPTWATPGRAEFFIGRSWARYDFPWGTFDGRLDVRFLDWSADDSKLLVWESGSVQLLTLPTDDTERSFGSRNIAWSPLTLVADCRCDAWGAPSGPYTKEWDREDQWNTISHFDWNGRLQWTARIRQTEDGVFRGPLIADVFEHDGIPYMLAGQDTGTYGGYWSLGLVRLEKNGDWKTLHSGVRAITSVGESQWRARSMTADEH